MALFCSRPQLRPSNGSLNAGEMHVGLALGNRSRYDFEEENSLDVYDEYESVLYDHDSDEDTEDASETDKVKQEACTEMKEQMYQEKLQNLRKQLQSLKDGVHPEYNKRMKKLDQAYKERLRLNDIFHKYELECVEREFINEKKAAAREFEEKKIELRESLIVDLEEKKKTIENERLTMEFTGDSMEVKPVTTRKLRRRPNDPVPLPEKRRKTSPAQLNYLLDDNLIMDDLKLLNKGKPLMLKKPTIEHALIMTSEVMTSDARIEDCRLYYDKRWFQRGQPVYVESKETGKYAGIILSMANAEIWIRKLIDHTKIRVHLSELQRGKVVIRRRST